jgi:Cu(I)/Ag(I) efflux system membrane fusion protein
MHPQIRQSEPGDCPICGMELIPLADAEQDELNPDAVNMSATAMQLANVRTDVVGTMIPIKHIRLNGKVQVDERTLASQASHIPGRIEELKVNFTGEHVHKGEILAYVYSPELVTAQEELFEAQKIKETQPGLFKAARNKLKSWKLTDVQIDQIVSKGTATENFPVRAEVSGYVVEKLVNEGDYLKKGEIIYRIADLSRLWVLFDIYESDMQWVKEGEDITFRVQSLPGESFSGMISYVDPIIDPVTRVAKARVVVQNKAHQLKPEMFVTGELEASLREGKSQLVIPKSAVMWTGKRSVAYVKQSSDRGVNFSMRELVLGPSLGDSYIIKSGLEAGEEIAVNGTFSIDAAAQLAGKASMMNREQPQHYSLSEVAKNKLSAILNAYLEVKNSLVKDDFQMAQKNAAALEKHIKQVPMHAFDHDAHQVWMKFKKPLEGDALSLSKAKDMTRARHFFITLSDQMIDLLKTLQWSDNKIYVQHCPMADHNKGADWLSAESEIRNPYFGASMLTCGEVTAEL